MMRENAIVEMLAAESASENIAARLQLQMSMIPIIDLKAARSYLQSLQGTLNKQLAVRAMDVSSIKGEPSEMLMKNIYAGLMAAGVFSSAPLTEASFDTAAASDAMSRAIAEGRMKPLFGYNPMKT